MEGDTPSYLGLIDNGLNAYHCATGLGRMGWPLCVSTAPWRRPIRSGRKGGDMFFRTGSQDAVKGVDGEVHVSDQATIWALARGLPERLLRERAWIGPSRTLRTRITKSDAGVEWRAWHRAALK